MSHDSHCLDTALLNLWRDGRGPGYTSLPQAVGAIIFCIEVETGASCYLHRKYLLGVDPSQFWGIVWRRELLCDAYEF